MKKQVIRDKIKTFLYMLCMILVILGADTMVANATSDDIIADSILSNEPIDENRTNINEPGSAETAEDLKELNIANNLTISYDNGNGELSGTLRILLILTLISLAPILLVTLTSFTRILIVLHFTRQALNTATVPPNQILIAISLFLTFFIMQPIFTEVYEEAVIPFEAGELTTEEAFEVAIVPMREFMMTHTQTKDADAFMQIANIGVGYLSVDRVGVSFGFVALIIAKPLR